MNDLPSRPDPPAASARHRRRRMLLDLGIVFFLVAVVVTNSALAPSHTYAYAQLLQCGAAVGMIESGDWLLPRNHHGGLARKPQLLTWSQVAVLTLTGVYNDFTYRLPTVLASLITAALVYLLSRRWYGRRTGLLAACLWVACHHMAKEMYVGLTDMMLTMWLTASILCADRLLFHRAPRPHRRWWAVALWATMALGAITKGWGVLNLTLVGGVLALATAVGPGFGALRRVDGFRVKLALVVRVVLRRWRRAMRAVGFIPGVLALVAVLAPVWWGMMARGGEEFQGVARYEIVKRIFGGADGPSAGSAPQWLNLLYYSLPASVMAVGALALTARTPWPTSPRWHLRPLAWLGGALRHWFSGHNPIFLPLCWTVAIVGLFSIPHGSRPDYLLPSFAAVAMMGAWAVDALDRLGGPVNRTAAVCRHVIAGVPVVIGAGLVLLPAAYLFGGRLGATVQKGLKLPPSVPTATWYALAALGAAVLAWAIRSSLRWRMRSVAAVAVVGMLGVMFVDRHFISRHARTRDGEKMIAFARAARPIVGEDRFAVYKMGSLAVEAYLGRFGTPPADWKPAPGRDRQAAWTPAALKASDIRWLLTCDAGLADWGEARGGSGPLQPAELGDVMVLKEPIMAKAPRGETPTGGKKPPKRRWGRLYLIRLNSAPATAPARGAGL